MGYEQGLRFSKVVSIGNQSDLTFVDFLQYLGSDPKTNIICAYIEGVKSGRNFIDVGGKVSKSKPIIIWKAGRTEAATRAITSHTGSLAGDHAIHEAASKQAGIITAHGSEEFLDMVMAFSCPYLPNGNKVGIIVDAGGAGVAASDACETIGLKVVTLPEKAKLELKDLLRGVIPPFSGVSNPVDLVWLPMGQASSIHPQIVEIMSETVDAFVIFTYDPFAGPAREIFAEDYRSEMLKAREKVRKPIVFVTPHPSRELDISLWTKNGLPVYPTPERAAKALSALVQRHDFLEKLKN
jgi:acyl-CoA synthetase (NDP forming)